MKKVIAAAGLGAAIAIGSLAGAGTASAATNEDYVSCVGASSSLYSSDGPSSLAAHGRQFAGHISSGLRTPLQERDWVYYNTGSSVSRIDANVLVNCATQIWLGYGSEGPSA